MKRIAIIIILLLGIYAYAQTPFDSFAPEMSQPMLDLRGPVDKQETVPYAIVADMQSQTLLLVDVSCGEVVATAPITDDISKWLSVDPLADEFPDISPYAYCNWNPIKNIDLHGDSTQLWVETEGVGHTWITTGEGDDMIVYSYGRYDDLDKNKRNFRSLTMKGDGVLLRLTGEEARQYQDEKIAKTNPISVVIHDITDTQTQEYFDNVFYGSEETPSNERSKYYQNPNAHVIDIYHLLNNNCTTKSIQAINALGSNMFYQQTYIPSPNGQGYYMNGNIMFIPHIDYLII